MNTLIAAPTTSSTARENPWDAVLTDGHASLVRARRLFRYLPSEPRCKLCNNPFGGVAGRVLSVAGFRPSRKNPNLCSRCCDALPGGGAEVDVAVLFADVRGSTALGRRGAATDFASLLNRFYGAATHSLLRHDAVIDKLIGDEVMAFFVRGISGPHYRERAVRAGLDLLAAVGDDGDGEPWLQVGVAVNAGTAFVGNVGEQVVDFTALGDTVNVCARMQGHAAGGELLVASGVADDLVGHAQRRTLRLRDRPQPLDAFVLGAGGSPALRPPARAASRPRAAAGPDRYGCPAPRTCR
ncbi:adenylate/guanylate cyclase domain-containing protein [Mycolicibacterium psychrotolerans]|nr:adenylate/guanylate cyclase domain-containing protein [Mycolicibacterium psychrotolerans]